MDKESTPLPIGDEVFHVGGPLSHGNIRVLDAHSREIIDLRARDAFVGLGGTNNPGQIWLYGDNGLPVVAIGAVIDKDRADISIGGNAKDGNIRLLDAGNGETVQVRAGDSFVGVGNTNNPGQIWVVGDNGYPVVAIGAVIAKDRADISIGGNAKDGNIRLLDANNKAKILLVGNSGDIILSNADCAEDFDLAPAAEAEPGTVMVLGPEGTLQPSTVAYDKTVLGVVSGAGEYKPGIILDRCSSDTSRVPLALVDKVYCKVDATSAAVEMGDLLTTSSMPGHAMKATDPLRAFGAVIGKALQPLVGGVGLIPILVALQ